METIRLVVDEGVGLDTSLVVKFQRTVSPDGRTNELVPVDSRQILDTLAK